MIRSDVLNKNGIDYNAGLERLMGNTELFEMVLAAFTRADIARRARAAYDANDRDALLNVVHEAKGSSGSMGLSALYEEACALVKLLRSRDYTDDELTERFLRFESLCVTAETAIKAALV